MGSWLGMLLKMLFFALWNNFDPAYSEKEILSFLYTTGRNKCFDQLRLQKVIENKIKDLKDTIYSDTFFLDEITRRETYRIVRESIHKLPERSRQIAFLALQGIRHRRLPMNWKFQSIP